MKLEIEIEDSKLNLITATMLVEKIRLILVPLTKETVKQFRIIMGEDDILDWDINEKLGGFK